MESHEKKDWPTLVRGNIAYGNDGMMTGCEQRGLSYLYKLRQSQRVAQSLVRSARRGGKTGWHNAGQGWDGINQEFELQK